MVVYRLKDMETLLGRSFCRHCKHQIRFYDNIPLLSFLLLRGECRDCGKKISWQYPLVESVTGILFALTAYYFYPLQGTDFLWIEFSFLLVLISLFVVIAVYDLLYMEIPILLLIASGILVLGFLALSYSAGQTWWESRVGLGLSGGLAVFLFFFTLVFVSREKWMGWGDVWLGGIAGVVVGLPLALFMLTLSFGIGALISIGAMFFSDKGLKSQIPFAPFLVGGVLLTIFLPKAFPVLMQLFLL